VVITPVQESASRSISCYYSNIRQQHLLEYIRYYSSTGERQQEYIMLLLQYKTAAPVGVHQVLLQYRESSKSISWLLLQYRRLVRAYHAWLLLQYRRAS
jgi:hypothetical protein